MPAKAKPVCGKGHERPAGTDCRECARERALLRYHAKKDEINPARNEKRRGNYDPRPVERDSLGRPLCKRGHIRQEGHACQECRRAFYAEKYQGKCGKGHAKEPGESCRPCEAERSNKKYHGDIEASRAESLRRYYERRAAGTEKLSTETVRAWREANPERTRKMRVVHQNRRRARLAGNGGSHTVAEWDAILEAHGHKCAFCGAGGKLTEDHIWPIEHGGPDFAWNLRPLCGTCNCSRTYTLLEIEDWEKRNG